MRKPFLALVLLMFTGGLMSLPTTITLPEKEYIEYIQSVRTRKFSDREIDRLHQALAQKLEEMKFQVDNNRVKNKARYNSLLPEPEEILFLKDKEGKEYFNIQLGQGISWDEYPTGNINESRVYLYPTEDKKGLSKVIVQYARVNFTGRNYVKEIRRIINSNPVFPGPPKFEGEKVNGDLPKDQEPVTVDAGIAPQENGDIIVEYYSGHDSNHNWNENNPTPEAKVSITQKLQDEKDLLSFEQQKLVYLTYRNILRELDSKMKNKVHNLNLDRKTTTRKITNFN